MCILFLFQEIVPHGIFHNKKNRFPELQTFTCKSGDCLPVTVIGKSRLNLGKINLLSVRIGWVVRNKDKTIKTPSYLPFPRLTFTPDSSVSLPRGAQGWGIRVTVSPSQPLPVAPSSSLCSAAPVCVLHRLQPFRKNLLLCRLSKGHSST